MKEAEASDVTRPAPVLVVIRYRPEEVELEITDVRGTG